MGGERERDVLVTHIATCSCCTGKKPTQSKERIHTYTAKKKFRKLKFVCHAKMMKRCNLNHIFYSCIIKKITRCLYYVMFLLLMFVLV